MTVQQLLGHAHINMTIRYAHLAPEHRAKAVKALDSAFVTAPERSEAAASNASGTKTGTVENQTL